MEKSVRCLGLPTGCGQPGWLLDGPIRGHESPEFSGHPIDERRAGSGQLTFEVSFSRIRPALSLSGGE
jgi:hypothetical protein